MSLFLGLLFGKVAVEIFNSMNEIKMPQCVSLIYFYFFLNIKNTWCFLTLFVELKMSTAYPASRQYSKDM